MFIDTNVLIYRAIDSSPHHRQAVDALTLAEGGFAGKQIHDACHVAVMLAHHERKLLTFNVADFKRFKSKIDIISI
jgi:predicted nucleic acid-binding protein